MKVLADSGFWFALYNKRDQFHNEALEIFDLIEKQRFNILIPFPTLYEVINTRFVKNISAKKSFNKIIINRTNKIIEDKNYKEKALKEVFESDFRTLSLVDIILRKIISDINIKINALITFNKNDFIESGTAI